jgi:uncharacterized membrane protein
MFAARLLVVATTCSIHCPLTNRWPTLLIEHIRNGRIAAGFGAAIERCGAVLAAHAPPDGSANELPDRVYVI